MIARRGDAKTRRKTLVKSPLPLRVCVFAARIRSIRFLQPARAARGFTLIELAVVMLLLVILLGMAGMRLTRDRPDIIRDEARRLVIMLQGAQQQAVLEGRPYAFALTRDGYRFLRADNAGKLHVVGGEVLPPHTLPYPMKLESSKTRTEADKRPDIVFDPSGDFGAFVLTLRFDEIRWYVEGSSDGEIRSSGVHEAPTT
jgi:general secretion pathway protein H